MGMLYGVNNQELRILLVADIPIKVLELNGYAYVGGAVGTLSRC